MTSTVVSFVEFYARRQIAKKRVSIGEDIEKLIESLNTAVRNEDLSLSEACLLLIRAKQRQTME